MRKESNSKSVVDEGMKQCCHCEICNRTSFEYISKHNILPTVIYANMPIHGTKVTTYISVNLKLNPKCGLIVVS